LLVIELLNSPEFAICVLQRNDQSATGYLFL
ncbi:unnamed protein product, partial [marine sediment metagenome]